MIKCYMVFLILFLSFSYQISLSASEKLYKPDNTNIYYCGRIDFSNPECPLISGSAAYFELKFRGSSCELLFKDEGFGDNYNYMAIVLDGEYKGRIKVVKEITSYKIAEDLDNKIHTLLVAKATEPQVGYVEFNGIKCEELMPFQKRISRRIEFIGNSITCGMGLDESGIPCDSGKWIDQHNAYLAYGPLAARALNADWLLSSYSGIGMTRFWNAEGPTMPERYLNTFLKADSSSLWNSENYAPDLISICLGQNDFSDGDGSYDRGDLDSTTYVNDYIGFVKMLREKYPDTPICMLTSPMQDGVKDQKMKTYLAAIKKYLEEIEKEKRFFIYAFPEMMVGGCSWHPNKKEHEKMAEGLIPFYKKVMEW